MVFHAPPAFVGRTAELEQLHERLTAAGAGQGGVMLLAGEPGIGKTRLAEELAARAQHHRALVLWGRCNEGEGAPAFWPWRDAIRSYLRGRDPAGVRTALGTGASDVAQIIPEIAALLPNMISASAAAPGVTDSQAADQAQARFRRFDAVAEFLIAATAVQPLVIILDDLHWADVPSLLLLEYVARRVGAARLLLIGTYRDIEVTADHPLAHTLGQLVRIAHLRRLDLRGLADHDVARIIEDLTGAVAGTDMTAAVSRTTEGNPFFIGEIVRYLGREGGRSAPPSSSGVILPVPPSVQEVIGLRLARLAGDARRLLDLAAVLGREFGVATLAQVGEVDVADLLTLLEQAEAARLIAVAAVGSYRFTHALVRETLYDTMPHSRRVRLHLQAAIALERLWGDDPEHLAELAWHFTEAAPTGDLAAAASYARKAGDHALALLAYEEAARWYQSALRTLEATPRDSGAERGELLLRLGEVYGNAGDGQRAMQTLRLAADLARRRRDARRLARAALSMGELGFGRLWAHAYLVDQPLVDLLEEANAALAAAQDGERREDATLRARVLARLATQLQFSGQHVRCDDLSRRAIALARTLDDPVTLAYTLVARHLAIWGPENVEERLALATESLRLAETVGDRELALTAHVWRRTDLLELGEGAASDREIALYAGIAERLRQPHFLGYTAMFRGSQAMRQGSFDEAERFVQEAYAIGDRVQDPNAFWNYYDQLAVLRRDQGRVDEVEATIRGFIEERPERFGWRCALADLYAELGRETDARRELEILAARDFTDLAGGVFGLYCFTTLARVCAFLDDARRAEILYKLLLPFARSHAVSGRDAPAYCGSVAHALGLLATVIAKAGGRDPAAAARWNSAEHHFNEALELHHSADAPPWLARTRLACATVLHDRHDALCGARSDRCDHRGRAHDLAEQALTTARGLGMLMVVVQSEDLLADLAAYQPATGPDEAPAQPRGAAAPAGLTPREVEVLRLLAAGHTNRELAGALVVTVNTVQTHLQRIYAKIGARSRSEAVAFAVRHGLTRTDEAPH
jgi:predicted ATPase/DNA-binding CsgD family transcriptional regulator